MSWKASPRFSQPRPAEVARAAPARRRCPRPRGRRAERHARRQAARRPPRRLARPGGHMRGMRARGRRSAAGLSGPVRASAPGRAPAPPGSPRLGALEDAAVADQPRQRARGEGAAREAEELDLVARRIGRRRGSDRPPPSVAISPPPNSPPSTRSAARASRPVPRPVPTPSRWQTTCATPSGPTGQHRLRELRDVGRMRGVEPAPGAVAGDDDAFHGRGLRIAAPRGRPRGGAIVKGWLGIWEASATPSRLARLNTAPSPFRCIRCACVVHELYV